MYPKGEKQMKTQILKALALLGLMVSSSNSAFASDKSTFRISFGLGPWAGSFSESDSYGHQASLHTLPSLGMQFQLGGAFGPIWVEYNASWFLPRYILSIGSSDSPAPTATARDAVYNSLLGLNVGLRLPILPIEPYVGLESANFGLSSGSKTDFDGWTPKLGLNFFLSDSFGFKGEYRKMLITSDDAGSLPSGVTAGASVWYLGIVFGTR